MRRRQFLSATAGLSLSTGVALGAPASRARQQSGNGPFDPVGATAVDGIKEVVVGPDGTTVYAAVTDGFATIDVSDPANPTVLAERSNLLADRENGPIQQIYDVKVDGDRLVVVGPANPKRDAVNAAVFYDVADPAAPRQIGVYETDYPIHNCDFADGVAYLTGNRRARNDLELIADPGDPGFVGSWSIVEHNERWADVYPGLRTLHDVSVQDGRAYLAHWDAGTWIVDVSEPSSPTLVSRVRGRSADELASYGQTQGALESIRPPGNDHYVAVDDDASVLGIGMESWAYRNRGGPSGIELWDISDPTNPSRRSTIDPPPTSNPNYRGEWTTSHNFEFVDDRLYTSWYRGGVRVFDVSDPGSPAEIAAWRDSETTSFWTAQVAGDAIVASSGIDRNQGTTIPDRLVTFPVPGADVDVPAETPALGTGTRTESGTGNSTTSAANETEPETTTSDASGPGFGVLAALAGLGFSAWRQQRS
jgi:hypothetical protein